MRQRAAVAAATASLPPSPQCRLPSPRKNTPCAAAPNSCPCASLRVPPATLAPPLSLQGPGSPAPSRSEPETRQLPFQNSDNNRDAGNNNYHRYGESAPPAGQRSAPHSPSAALGPGAHPSPSQLPRPPRTLKAAPGVQPHPLSPSKMPGPPRLTVGPSRLPWAPQVPQASSETHSQSLTAAPGPRPTLRPSWLPQTPKPTLSFSRPPPDPKAVLGAHPQALKAAPAPRPMVGPLWLP